jgi:hypothetical protein
MLLGMLLSFCLAAGWYGDATQSAAWAAAIRGGVPQQKRAEKAVAALEQMRGETQRYDDMLRSRLPELQRLARDQRASRAAFEQLFGSFDADRIVTERRVLDARFALRDSLNEAEWRAVFGR